MSDANKVIEVYGKDKKTKKEFYVGWSLTPEEAVDLIKKEAKKDQKNAYEFFIKYPADKGF